MKKTLITLLATCLFLAVTSQLAAQNAQQQPGPPPVLFIFREEVKASRGSAHENMKPVMSALFKKPTGLRIL